MDLPTQHKRDVEYKIVDTVATALEQNKISMAEARTIASFILDRIYKINTQEELTALLSELSSRWPIFANVSVIEHGVIDEKKEDVAVKSTEDLIDSGMIDEALKLAKETTHTDQGAS